MFPMEKRDACICGYRSPWKLCGHNSTHPHLVTTVSRTDLTPVTQPVGVRSVQKFTDGTWVVFYRCGHEVHGVDSFDLARARRGHTAGECAQVEHPAGRGL